MTIQKLERVMWLVRSSWPNQDIITNHQLKLAIMKEIGTDRKTYRNNRRALKELGWIRTKGTQYIILTNKDLS